MLKPTVKLTGGSHQQFKGTDIISRVRVTSRNAYRSQELKKTGKCFFIHSLYALKCNRAVSERLQLSAFYEIHINDEPVEFLSMNCAIP